MNLKDFQQLLIEMKLTDTLNRNTPEANRQAIREFLALNTYWTFDAHDVDKYKATYEEVATIMAKSLGMSDERFASDEPPYIHPGVTTDGLIELRNRLLDLAEKNGKVLFATAHPGSLMSFYQILARGYAERGGTLVRLPEPIPAPDNRWLDDVDGVVVLSDEGNLMHAHIDNGFEEMVRNLKPDLVVSDHGFAMGAINAEVPTIAIFDVDDPALAFMYDRFPHRVFAFPMNDNQTNTRSAKAAEALWKVKI